MENKENNYNVKIAEWIKGVRFQKKFFGGVSEEDVWKKIEDLNKLYEASLQAEKIRYDSLIDHFKKTGREGQDSELVHDE